MKRYFLMFFLMLITFIANADERSDALIAKVKAKINSTSSYRVNFSSEGINGILTVSGYKFALISSESEAYYDGKTLWNYNKKEKEVNVEDLNPNDPNVMVNPSKLLDVNEKDFSHRALGANIVELTPKSVSTLYSKIVLTINLSTSLPENVEITDRESGEKAIVKVSGFTQNVSVTTDTFRFDVKKHKGVDIVDFR